MQRIIASAMYQFIYQIYQKENEKKSYISVSLMHFNYSIKTGNIKNIITNGLINYVNPHKD